MLGEYGEVTNDTAPSVGVASTDPGDVADGGVPSGQVLAVAVAKDGKDERGPHSTKVRIETPGATIEIDAKAELDVVARTALRLFHEAGGWPREDVRSAGFATAERRDTPTVQPGSMPWAPGAHSVQEA